MPARRASSLRAAASSASSSVEAARVASVVTRMPPGGVGRARHPRGELVPAVAREHEVRVRVDEARDHAAARRVDPLVGRGAGALDRGDAAVVDDERGVADEAERALAERRRRW